MSQIRVVVVAIVILLCVPAVARAERPPTPKERTAIEGAARRAYADHYFKVRVSRVEVSTVERRFATAVVATFHRREPQRSPQRRQEWFYRTSRGWVAWFSTAMPDVEMPIDVERDLGIAGPAPLFGIPGKTAVLIVFGALLLIAVAILRFRVAREDGVPTPTPPGGGSEPSRSKAQLAHEPAKRRCGTCNGTGTMQPPVCLLCGGSGRIPNPNNDPGVPFINCYRGPAAHQPYQCQSCNGTGEV